MAPRLTPLVASLPATVPFVGPETGERARGVPFRARLGANESVFGPSPKAIAAMAEAAAVAWRYGDPEAHDLRAAVAAHHGVAPENIMLGEGIDGLLGYLVRMLVTPGTPVVTSLGTYPTFNYHVTGYGGVLRAVPYNGDATDPLALATAARESGAPLVYLANPDNPMGGWHSAGMISALIAALPEDAVLCLDEAYADFAPPEAIPPIDVSEPRVIRMRTFSKAHGLAGARIGYAIGHADLIAAFDRVRNHFGLGVMAQAGALAALSDRRWLAEVVARVVEGRARLGEIAAARGLRALPSATNFVTIDCGRDGAFARRVLAGMIARGVFIRMPFVAPQDRCVRISVGRPAELAIVAQALPAALDEAERATRHA
ncbi:MAG: pyridoxal phosphate-dependent aminotransferase [Amaricoccus sp.]|uniref:pyridoxal phosphate-dependent aminotransferase n=1 Tax=Amaricoccus sp. TaxID=1872485 RepID=UPI003315CA8E